jgi:hypothetical protein
LYITLGLKLSGGYPAGRRRVALEAKRGGSFRASSGW